MIARYLAPSFKEVIGTDPSPGMVKQAQSQTPTSEYPNVTYREAGAESLPFIEDGSVDMVVSGQAAHWFKYEQVWPEMKRILRPGGTLAFWGYKDNVFVDYPYATELLHKLSSPFTDDPNTLGPYWEPGRKIMVRKLRDVSPPPEVFEDEQRIEYEPAAKGARSGEGTMFVHGRMTVQGAKEYLRTFSSIHAWQEAHPDRTKKSEGGPGDFVDALFEQAALKEDIWNHDDEEVDVEWGSILLMVRKR